MALRGSCESPRDHHMPLRGVVVSSFFDDYSLLESHVTAESATGAVETLLKRLGRLYDSKGSKYNPFMQSAAVLGVSLEIRTSDLVDEHTEADAGGH
eukprot:745661-Amphidinium_carterae.1